MDSKKSRFDLGMTGPKRKLDQKSNRFSQHTSTSVYHQCMNIWTNDEPQPSKKLKIDTVKESTVSSVHQTKLNLSNFQFKRMLNCNTLKKEIIVEGKFVGHESPAIVIIEKKISNQWLSLQMDFFNSETSIEQVSTADVYGDYICFPKVDRNGWKMRIIHPASQKHLDKLVKTMEKIYLINETYEIYEKITRPYIVSEPLSVKWISDILNGQAEQDRIIHSDDDKERGFVMLPDSKWNGSLDQLHLIIISRKKIMSLRDLNETHLPLLKNIRDVGTSIMKNKYDLPPSQFKMSVHYQPTYYHFHVLVSNLMYKNQGEHLLSTVINNIEMVPNYYQRAELVFFLKERHQLCKKYRDNGIVISNEAKPTITF